MNAMRKNIITMVTTKTLHVSCTRVKETLFEQSRTFKHFEDIPTMGPQLTQKQKKILIIKKVVKISKTCYYIF